MVPSKVARKLAGDAWPEVQFQRKLAKGIYGFTCAGHGGVIAVIDETNLDAHAIECARATGKIELVATWEGGRSSRMLTSEAGYTKDSLREWAQAPGRHLYECWVGEEDCDWATIFYALNEQDFERARKAGYCVETLTREDDVRRSLETWNPEFLARYERQPYYLHSRTDFEAKREDGGYETRHQVWRVGADEPEFWTHDEDVAQARLRLRIESVAVASAIA